MCYFVSYSSDKTWIKILDQQRIWDEVHVRYTVLKACCDKSSDRENNGKNLICRAAGTIRQPDRKAHQSVRQYPQRHSLYKSQVYLCHTNPQCGNSNCVGAKSVLFSKEH